MCCQIFNFHKRPVPQVISSFFQKGVIILFVVIGCILVLLLIVGIICKKYLRGDFQTKRKIDDADEPLLEDCYDEFTGKHEVNKNTFYWKCS